VAARVTQATRALQAAKIAFTVHEYQHDPATTAFGDEAVKGLGVDAARVFKTLVVEADAGRERIFAVAVVPVSSQLDLKAAAGAMGAKRVSLAEAADAERLTGYVVGGISPIGQKRALQTLVDASASTDAHATVFVSAGRRGLQIEIAPADLVRVTKAKVVEISRG
jgi:Cys-tRNA(Pro)/Cys-tRNA(Cys) deacylase